MIKLSKVHPPIGASNKDEPVAHNNSSSGQAFRLAREVAANSICGETGNAMNPERASNLTRSTSTGTALVVEGVGFAWDEGGFGSGWNSGYEVVHD